MLLACMCVYVHGEQLSMYMENKWRIDCVQSIHSGICRSGICRSCVCLSQAYICMAVGSDAPVSSAASFTLYC